VEQNIPYGNEPFGEGGRSGMSDNKFLHNMVIHSWISTVPDIKDMPNGKQVCEFKIAFNDGKNDNRRTEWLCFSAYDALGLHIYENYKKGSFIRISKTKKNLWQGRDGKLYLKYTVEAIDEPDGDGYDYKPEGSVADDGPPI